MTDKQKHNADVIIGDVEWDADKEQLNIANHGYDFREAATVFDDPNARSDADPEHSIDENRWRTIGYSARGNLLRLSHTMRDDRYRIINAYQPTRAERKLYEED